MNKNREMSYSNSPFASMEVQSVLLDGESEIAVILLANAINEEEIFPIVAGLYGGERIVSIIKKGQCLRSFTHDLLIDIIRALQGKVEKVVMDKDSNEDVVSTIHISRYSKRVLFEARACDALAVALTSHAPIYVRKSQLLTPAQIIERVQHINDQRFLAWLNAFDGSRGKKK